MSGGHLLLAEGDGHGMEMFAHPDNTATLTHLVRVTFAGALSKPRQPPGETEAP